MLAATLALLLAGGGIARAWEPQTTHAGLAEQAALASRLHKRLELLGFGGGLFEPLTIPPADAPALMAALKLLSPTHGSVPDARGRQIALSWLTAGAALADLPAAHGANHFFDPATGSGWRTPDRSLGNSIGDLVRDALGRASIPAKGVAAPDWIVSKDNPFDLDQFLHQYGNAASASTPGERQRAMASALIAAGAMMHTLGDVGVPSRVRADYGAHLQPLGGGPDDLGSRFERIASLAFGRLGVPAPSRVVTRDHLRDFFTTKTGEGLADEVSRTYFSPGTLPGTARVSREEKPELARPLPALPARLNLMAAARDEGTTLRNLDGVCLARYRVEHDILQFWLDDECMLDEVGAILPEVSAYETGLLDWLLRGELTITPGETVVITAKGLGAGTVEVLLEDDRGVRTPLSTTSIAAGAPELGHLPSPSTGTRLVAVFRGVDALGEPLVAVGALPLTH
jgi:hypothetical protein